MMPAFRCNAKGRADAAVLLQAIRLAAIWSALEEFVQVLKQWNDQLRMEVATNSRSRENDLIQRTGGPGDRPWTNAGQRIEVDVSHATHKVKTRTTMTATLLIAGCQEGSGFACRQVEVCSLKCVIQRLAEHCAQQCAKFTL